MYLWGNTRVNFSLYPTFIWLWEIKNKEIHGKTKERNETMWKKKLTIETKQLNSIRNKVRPVNKFLFYDNVDKFIEKSSTKRICSCVCSHHNAIKNSVSKCKESSLCGTKSIVEWSCNINSAKVIDRLHCHQHRIDLGPAFDFMSG